MKRSHMAFFLLSILLFAVTCGYYTGRQMSLKTTSFTLQEDTRKTVPVVTISGIRNGLLHGSITGTARLVVGGTIFADDGVFAVDASKILVNEIGVRIPEGAEFVASKRGKKYYPISSSSGKRITPSNRVYFHSEKEAQQSGYSK